MKKQPTFSFLLPTRANVVMLRDFLESLRVMCSDPSIAEVVICYDSDDVETRAFDFGGLSCQRVVARPGMTMGALNNLCLSAASGKFVMLANDDIVVRTHAWDKKIAGVLDAEPNHHLLVHVNDGIFGRKLCTFPMLSRETVEMIGLCNEGYRRYAIDDHICEIFHILKFLGHDRIRYLEDVVFEHLNFNLRTGEKIYIPRTPPEQDWSLFRSLLGVRKKAALILALAIDGHEANKDRYVQRLARVDHDKKYRRMAPFNLAGDAPAQESAR